MLKRGLSLFLSIVMVLSLMPLQAFAADDVTEPTGTEPVVTEPVVTEPEASEPVVTEPVVTEPVVTEPVVTEPVVTEPVVTEPVVTEPVVTEPVVTEPVVTEPVVTEPVVTEPVVTEPPEETELQPAVYSVRNAEAEFSTFEELKLLAENSYQDYTIAWYVGEGPLVISENLTIPKNLSVNGNNEPVPFEVTIGQNAELTIMEDSSLSVDVLNVQGTLIQKGGNNVRKALNVTGRLELYSDIALDLGVSLNLEGNVEDKSEWGNAKLYFESYPETIEELKASVAAAKADVYNLEHRIYMDVDAGITMTLTEDLVVPENAMLRFGSENATIIIDKDATVTLNSDYNFVATNLVVEGTLVNNGEFHVNNDEWSWGTLRFTETGAYKGTGYIYVSTDISQDWTTLIGGLKADDKISVRKYYNEYYNTYDWEIRDISNLTKLATPTNLVWHKEARMYGDYNEFGDFVPTKSTWFDAIGNQGWEIGSPHNDECLVTTYYEDAAGNITETSERVWIDTHGGVIDKFSLKQFVLMNPQSGTYWFTVQAIANQTDYADSEIATSPKFKYTKPGKALGKPSNLRWEWPYIYWDHAAGCEDGTMYQYEFWFAETLDEEPDRIGWTYTYYYPGSWPEVIQDYMIQEHGDGYYYFRVRTLSDDITKIYNSEWTEFSEPYCLSAVVQGVKDQLQSITSEATEEEIRNTVQSVDTEELRSAMLADDGSLGVIDALEELEEAVGGAAKASVSPAVSAFNEDLIKIVGANLNSKENTSGEIKLVLDEPEHEIDLTGSLYEDAVAIKFSMDLENVQNTDDLAVPVKVTLPIPETIDPYYLVILHYPQSGEPEVISGASLYQFRENGQWYVSFVLTHFSDFAMTHYKEENQAGGGDDQFSWSLTNRGKLKISGEGAMPDYDVFTPAPWNEYSDSITSIVVEDGITEIGNYAFMECTNVTSISLPDSLTYIGDFAINAVKMEDITIPAYVTNLGSGAIGGFGLKNIYVDEDNTAFRSEDGVLFNKDMTVLLTYPDAKSGTFYAVPEGVETIYKIAFADNKNLTEINLPATLRTIDAVAFGAAANLEKICFNGNFPEIANDTFTELSGVTAFYPATDDTWKEELLPTYGGAVVWQKSAYVEITGENTVVGGKSIKLTAEILPTNEFGKSVFWTLRDGDQAYATLTVSKGVATITAADVSEVNTITVEAYSDESVAPAALQITIRPKVTGLQVGMIETDEDGSHFFVKENETIILNEDQMDGFQMQLGAEGLPYGACSDVTWSASKSAAATVTANGLASFTGASGVVTFTATSKENSKIKGTVTYTVVEPMDVSAVGGTKIDLVGGQKVTLEILNNATGKPVKSKDITWGVYADDADADIYATMKSGKLTTKKVLKKTELVVCADIISDYKLLAQVIYNVTLYPAVTQVKIDVDGTETNGQTVYYDWSDPDRNEMTLTAVQYPDDAMPADVTWTISDKNAAYADYSVSGNKITITNPKMAGAVTFTATSNDGSKKKTSVKVQIGSFADEIKFFAAGTEVQNGILYAGNKTMDRVMLEAVVYAKDGSTAVTGSGVKWSLKNAADKSFVTVSAKGLVTAKTVYKQQNVVIVAASKDGMASAEIPITILPSDTSALTVWTTHENGVVSERNVTKDTIVLDMNSENPTVTLQAKFPDGTSTEGVTWTPAKDSAAADITDNGDGTFTVKMLKVGKVNVTAKVGKKSATVTVSATKLAEDIVISQKKTNATGNLKVASGKSLDLQAAVNNATNKKVTWSLKPEDEAYAKVSSSGKVTATKELTVQKTITVYAEAQDGSGQVDDIQVTIYPIAQGVQVSTTKAQAAMLFSMESNDYIISDGNYVWDMAKKDDQGNVMDIITLSALVYPYHQSNTQYSAMQDVTWKSSSPKTADFVRDENGNVVVDENGYVQLKCKNPGSVTITVTANDGSNKKVAFKLKIVRKIQELSLNLNDSVEVTEYDQIIVRGGKSVDLSKLISYDPAATEKTLYWFEGQGDGEYFASINAKGKVTTSKVTSAKDLYFVVSTENDPAYYNDNAATLLINILIVPG